MLLQSSLFSQAAMAITVGGVIFLIGLVAFFVKMYNKASQGQALVKTGMGGSKVSFSGMLVVPVIHKLEKMDITVKKITISREGKEGLICKDNMRADIQVNFFVRVNQTEQDVIKVAQSIGCARASEQQSLVALFDAKFSEALKTVGKHFDFVELYNSRDAFKSEILQIIGTDLNGYVLDDCAIDSLEQTPITSLDENNILDAEGIKKIITLTAKEKMEANLVQNQKTQTIKKQDVEARETILELERQMAEKEEKQLREVESIRARERAETQKVREEERLKSERARISTQEEIEVAEENKRRQVLVAEKNKERTLAIETERVQKDQQLEQTERERIVELANIEKEKALEEERKQIQDVIRERVIVEKAVVEEEEKIKETRLVAEADREKQAKLIEAEMHAQEALLRQTKEAEAQKVSAEFKAKQLQIEAEAEKLAADKKAEAIKILAEAEAKQAAASGLAEAQVMEAKAAALEKEGAAEASILEKKALAEAKGIDAKAEAEEKKGLVEAKIASEKYLAEAKGIEEKANAMQKLDGVGRDHEEFKLRLEKDTKIELAQISIQEKVASAQASVLAEALKSAKIDIVGGEQQFFDRITGAIGKGKQIEGLMDNSKSLSQVRDALFDTSDGSSFKENLHKFVDQFGMNTEDVRNLSVANLLNKMSTDYTNDSDMQASIGRLANIANVMGVADKTVGSLGLL